MSDVSEHVANWIVELMACGSVILVISMIIAFAVRHQRAALRHAVWEACMVSLCVMPILLSMAPQIRIPVNFRVATPKATRATVESQRGLPTLFSSPSHSSPYQSERQADDAKVYTAPLGQDHGDLFRDDRVKPVEHGVPQTAAVKQKFPWQALVWLWSFGAVFCFSRLVVSWIWLRRLGRPLTSENDRTLAAEAAALATRLGLAKSEVRILQGHAMPMAFGVIRPVVVLPESLSSKSSAYRQSVIVHEFCHLRRRDPLSNLFGELASVFFWINPLYWIARQEFSIARELACDDEVLQHGIDAQGYARCLVELSTSPRQVISVAAIGMAMSAHRIEKRVRALLDDQVDRQPIPRTMKGLVICTALFCAAPLALLRAQPPERQSSKTEQTDSGILAEPIDRPKPNVPDAGVEAVPKSKIGAPPNSTARGVQPESPEPPNIDEAINGSISGRILSTEGQSIENALVLSRLWSATTPVVTRVRTDAEGNFKLHFPEISDNKAARQYRTIYVWADGFQIESVVVEGLLKETDHVVAAEIRLTRETSTEFKVLDPAGNPLPNARVIPGTLTSHWGVMHDGRFTIDRSQGLGNIVRLEEHLMELFSSRSDQSGDVQVTGIPEAELNSVVVISDEFGAQQFPVRGTSGRLQLSPIGKIQGRLKIADPRPLMGMKLDIQAHARRENTNGPAGGVATAEIEADGTFHVPAFPTSNGLRIVAWGWNDSVNVQPVIHRGGSVTAGQTTNIEIETVTPVRVRGQVLTGDTHEPAPGAIVFLNCLTSPINGIRAVADNQGRFSLKIAPGRAIQQVVELGDDPEIQTKYDYPRLAPIEIPSNLSDIELDPYYLPVKQVVRGAVLGQVRNSEGRPIADAQIAYHRKDTGRIRAKTTTDQQGRFSVAVLEWNAIQSVDSIAARYQWSIIENVERTHGGDLARQLVPLKEISNNHDAMILMRP